MRSVREARGLSPSAGSPQLAHASTVISTRARGSPPGGVTPKENVGCTDGTNMRRSPSSTVAPSKRETRAELHEMASAGRSLATTPTSCVAGRVHAARRTTETSETQRHRIQ